MVVRRAALQEGCRLRASSSSSSSSSSALLDPAHIPHRHAPHAMVSTASAQQQVPRETVDDHIVTLCSQRQLKEALHLLDQQDGRVGHSAFACLLQSCSAMKALHEAKYLHYHMISGSLDEDTFLANMVMRMYDKCDSLHDARSLFDNMQHRNIVSWNMIIGAYSSRGHRKEVFHILCEMLHQDHVKPDKVTFITILGVCNSPSAFTDIKLLYGFIVEIAAEADITVGNVLINMYRQSGILEDAFGIFERMPAQNVITWNTLIAAYAKPGHEHVSFQLFQKMHIQDIARNKATFISTLNACVNQATLMQGKMIHFEIAQNGLDSDLLVGTSLVKMYGKCESLADACSVFKSMMPMPDVILWTTMMAAYIQQGHNKEALRLYQKMQHEGVKPNKITFVTILNACASPGALMDGKMIRDCIPDKDIKSDIILSNALITMYQKCGSFADAEQLFLSMCRKDVVSCTAMIAAYAEQSRGYEAIYLFEKMGQIGVKPDRFTFSSILDACASIAALAEGRLLHSLVIESGVEWDCVVGNALISMYGECGMVEDARSVFLKLQEQDRVSWSAIIGAYANHGYCKEALKLFQGMQQQGLKPTKITFISVLSACSHAGLINEGHEYFASMTRDHGITPTSEHYMCMIDLMGRAGSVYEAEEFINKMPLQPNAILWNTLLGACRVHGTVNKGQHAAECVLELDPQNEAAYVVLSNLYASAGRWEEALTVRKAIQICTNGY